MDNIILEEAESAYDYLCAHADKSEILNNLSKIGTLINDYRKLKYEIKRLNYDKLSSNE